MLEFNQSQRLQRILNSTHKKRIEAEKIRAKMEAQSIVQINEQCYIQKNNGKLEK